MHPDATQPIARDRRTCFALRWAGFTTWSRPLSLCRRDPSVGALTFSERQDSMARLPHRPHVPICHSEGAPHGTVLHSRPGARPRNLLSVSSWPAATPRAGPVWRLRRRAWRGLPRPASSRPRVDSSALQPAAHSSGGSAAGPRNDSLVSSGRPLGWKRKTGRVTTEESTVRLLGAHRDTPDGPRLAVAPPHAWRGLPRPASSRPRVDSSALQPAAYSSGGSAAGPRNDSLVSSGGPLGWKRKNRPRPYGTRPARLHPRYARGIRFPSPRGPPRHPGLAPSGAFRRRTHGAGCRVRPRAGRE